MTDPFDETMLAAALASGQPDELRAARVRHFDAMMLLIRSFTGGTDEEASQRLEEIWDSAVADYPHDGAWPRGPVRAWLYRRLLAAVGYAAVANDVDDTGRPEFETRANHPWKGWWKDYPAPWRTEPEEWVHTDEGRAILEGIIAGLPPLERVVLVARDLDGWSVAEVRALERLLPRQARDVLVSARLRVRAGIDAALREGRQPAGASAADEGGDHA